MPVDLEDIRPFRERAEAAERERDAARADHEMDKASARRLYAEQQETIKLLTAAGNALRARIAVLEKALRACNPGASTQ